MDEVFIESYDDGEKLRCNLESVITVYVCRLCQFANINLNVVKKLKNDLDCSVFDIDVPEMNLEFIEAKDIPSLASYCKWPVVVSGNTVVAGLCSVLRQIIKRSRNGLKLLGFREACLMACNESSIWTKYCEIDIISTVKNLVQCPQDYFKEKCIVVPINLSKFEVHMAQPVRIHNVYKIAREVTNDKSIKSSVPIEELDLGHTYSEGPFMTLSDVILYVCYSIIFQMYPELIEESLPLINNWYRNMQNHDLPEIKINSLKSFKDISKDVQIFQEAVPAKSLYASDPKRFKPQNRIFTKQTDIENSLNFVNDLPIPIKNDLTPFGNEIMFNWSDVPMEINPKGGSLPKKRADRKCEQLQNLLKPVLRLSRPNDTIVDFCSGSGHLGLLIAYSLPNCNIILIENKERSLVRAKERIEKLRLKNVTILQSNLDYFSSKFDIGVSLHACGVATDLVIQTCIENKAHFICCPCCYGGIHDCYHMKYPRSNVFNESNLKYGDYLNLAHAADQTHDKDNAKTKQGFFCMDVVDTDRKLYAEQFGYEVFIGKLQPVSCTPKNNLLVGVCKKRLL